MAVEGYTDPDECPTPGGAQCNPSLLRVEGNSADKQRSEILYANRGTSCHGENGAGIDENPLVWGANSFNQGAGFANNAQLAAWLKVAMPLDDAKLTERKAIDIAASVNSRERPVLRLVDHLPKDGQLGEYNGENLKNNATEVDTH